MSALARIGRKAAPRDRRVLSLQRTPTGRCSARTAGACSRPMAARAGGGACASPARSASCGSPSAAPCTVPIEVRHIMGMPIGIELPDDGVDVEPAFAWLRHVDATFSTYKPDSEISRLDRGELALSDCSP